MKRLTLIAVSLALAAFPSIAAAKASGGASHRAAEAIHTEWTVEYTFAAGYGAVTCTGKTTVNNKYPGGRDVETCVSDEAGGLKNMVAGKEQHGFKLEGGGEDGTWASDSPSGPTYGKQTGEYKYSVNKKLTKFKLVAIYPAPEEA